MHRIPGARLLNETAYSNAAREIALTNSLLFYMDDADWFAPDLPERLNDLDFGHRFQTNNYGIRTNRVPPQHVARLKDHVYGSIYAGNVGLSDIYFDTIISATNKTPCSASILPILFQNTRRNCHPDPAVLGSPESARYS